MAEYFWWIVILAAIGAAWTGYLFWGRRSFVRGMKKGTAQDPARVRHENPPDAST
jgi:hypothetical protein